MAARTDFDPWTWEEAERNRQRSQNSSPVIHDRPHVLLSAVPKARRADSLIEQCEELKVEIKRGRDYLALAKQHLKEHQGFLEDWPAFENHCGRNPIAHLVESVLVSERVVSFLTDWLKIREQRLMELSQRVAPFTDAKKTQRNHAHVSLRQ